MNCKITEELIYDYIDREWDDITTQIFNEHLKECEKCRRQIAETRHLFYEMNELQKEPIEMPKELDEICDKVYYKCNESKREFTIKDFINIQKEVFKRQVKFINYIPGIEFGEKTVKTFCKGAVKASGFLLRQGYKMALSR